MKQDKLSNLFDFLPKSKVKAGDGLEEGKYPFYTSSENQSKYLDEFQNEPGCLVFGTGGKASVHFTTSRFSTSTDCITIRPKPKAKINAGYVFQFFKGNMQVLESGFKGAGLKHISKAYLSDIQIPHPEELDDQKRIAHLLGKVEGLIARRKQHLQTLDDLLKSVFLEIFGDPVRNEKGWDSVELEKLCEEIIDCPHSTPVYSNERTGYFCVRSGDIVDGYLELSKTFQVRRDVYEERIKRYLPQKGDIVYAREGGRLGNAARIIGNEPICLGQRIMLFKASEDNNTDFLWALLESRSFKTKLQGLVGGGAAPRVNIKDLKKIEIIQPPNDIQTQFSGITKRIDKIKFHYHQSLVDLENLYGALSQKAFKGGLDLSRIELEPQQAPPSPVEDEHGKQLTPEAIRQLRVERKKTGKTTINLTYVKQAILAQNLKDNLTYPDMKRILEQLPYDFKPQLKDIQQLILNLLESEPPFLEQVFDYAKSNLKEKQILFRLIDED